MAGDGGDGGSPARPRHDALAPYAVHPMVPLDSTCRSPSAATSARWRTGSGVGTYTAGPRARRCRHRGQRRILGADRTSSWRERRRARLGRRRDDPRRLRTAATSPTSSSTSVSPTTSGRRLFLAQLPNLLAGNISIVHKVTGSSRTLLGEESAGVSAVEIAERAHPRRTGRHLPGRRHLIAERKDMLLILIGGGWGWKGGADIRLGAAREGRRRGHRLGRRLPGPRGARACRGRGKKPYARLGPVVSDRSHAPPRRSRGQRRDAVRGDHGGRPPSPGRAPLGRHRHRRTDARGARVPRRIDRRRRGGYGQVDRTFSAAASKRNFASRDRARRARPVSGTAYRPPTTTGFETPLAVPPKAIVVTTWVIWRGEGMGLVEASS